jgi:hypothetical protein
MTFIHGYLLFGLLLAGVPVLIHLLNRQKPRRIPFPAFRFLQQKQRSNQRRIRLRQVLLLALRMLIIAALCLGLARPRLFGQRWAAGSEKPVAVVLLVDTRPSMAYSVAGVSRLDEAIRRARELLDEVNPASRVAILDAGDDSGDAFVSPAAALTRLDNLTVRPTGRPLNRLLDRGYRLLQPILDEPEAPSCFLYLLSDRTRSSWESAGQPAPAPPPGVQIGYVDVGVDTPRDLAITRVEVVPPIVAPGGELEVRVSLRSVGGEQENQLSLEIDNDTTPDRRPETRPVHLVPGQLSDLIVFKLTAPRLPADVDASADVPFQITAKLGTNDALPLNDARHATFLVRAGRRLLTIAQDKRAARIWQYALEAVGSFRSDLHTLDEVQNLTPRELASYRVVCLFQVSHPGDVLLKKLAQRVRAGGGLAIVPPGGELQGSQLAAFNQDAAELLPAPLVKLVSAEPGTTLPWAPFRGVHPLMALFQRDIQSRDPDFGRPELWPFARRYWQTGPLAPGSTAISTYTDPARTPALLERSLSPGSVILFTTPLDDRRLDPARSVSPGWHNYWLPSSFGMVLIDRVCLYLAGDVQVADLNYLCGQVPQVVVPTPARPPYMVQGPGLAAAERNLQVGSAAPGSSGVVQPVPQASQPGNYVVQNGAGRTVAGFSLAIREGDTDLERVPVEEIEKVLGTGTVLPLQQSVNLADALQANHPPPVELLPLLMMVLLLVLTGEGLLASRFYRRTLAEASGPPGGTNAPEPAAAPGSPVSP